LTTGKGSASKTIKLKTTWIGEGGGPRKKSLPRKKNMNGDDEKKLREVPVRTTHEYHRREDIRGRERF